MKPLVVVPVFNEAESLEILLSRLDLEKFEFLIIDDGSEDDSGQISRDLGFEVIIQPQNFGKPQVVKRGFEEFLRRESDLVMVFDGDGQHPFDALQKMQALVKEGWPVVKGTRFHPKSPRIGLVPLDRKLVAVAVSAAIQEITGWRLTDPGCGLVGIQRDILEIILPLIKFDFSWEIELIMRLWQLFREQCPIYELPIPAIYELPAKKQKEKYVSGNLDSRLTRIMREMKKIIQVVQE